MYSQNNFVSKYRFETNSAISTWNQTYGRNLLGLPNPMRVRYERVAHLHLTGRQTSLSCNLFALISRRKSRLGIIKTPGVLELNGWRLKFTRTCWSKACRMIDC